MKRVYAAVIAALLLAAPLAKAEGAHVLAFGDSNTWGWKPTADGFPAERFDDATRWAGVLDAALPEATVVVDGQVGRLTNLDGRSAVGLVDADDFNGAKDLPEAIARHMPLDLVVIMLGTNDLQAGVDRTPDEIAVAAFELAELVAGSAQPVFTAYPAPQALVVAPPPMSDASATGLADLFQQGVAASAMLGAAFADEAERTGVPFFDAGTVTATDSVDGVHLTANNHRALGDGLAAAVRDLLNK